ncbi:MAG: ABC transporter substrate-binding protein [Xanthobacteraceae bacterium]
MRSLASRRKFIKIAAASSFVYAIAPSPGQSAKEPLRIGWLKIQDKNHTPGQLQAFVEALEQAGEKQGQTFTIVKKFADGDVKRLMPLAQELVAENVDVILATSQPAVDASLKATHSIPIVGRMTDDPIQSGAAQSLAKPGGNLTGVYSLLEEMTGKRLALLVQAVPSLRKVGALLTLDRGATAFWLAQAEQAAKNLNLEIYVMNVHSGDELDGLFERAAADGVNGLLAFRNPTVVTFDRRVAELAAKYRLPSIFDARDFVDAGAFMSYGPNLDAIFRRLASDVHEIAKGRSPAELPIEQPTIFELVINAKVAQSIGLTIPSSVLVSADELMQ